MARDLTGGVVNVPLEDDPLHSDEHPFCRPCHEDEALVAETNELYEDGLLTLREFNLTVMGRIV